MNEKKKNKNKGFSLVELIIVIAIMAILVAILAPQFLKYVERSRNTADIANAREISNAIIAYIADSEAENNTIEDGGTTVTVDKNEAKVTGKSVETVNKALVEAGVSATETSPHKDIKCKSKNSWTGYTIEVDVDKNGVIIFKYKATGGTDESRKKFEEAFQQTTESGSGSDTGSGSGSDTGSGGSGSTTGG